MKKWLESIKLIVLAILIIVLVSLLILRKSTNIDIKKVVEAFQQSPAEDIHTSFFDLSSNYFDLTLEEIGSTPNIPPDDVILNIGGSFGDIDASQIPWDAENASLTLEQGIYGAVSQAASTAIFKKLYMVNQLQNPDSLPYDPNTNHYKYQDPLFQVNTNDPATGNAAKVGEDMLNYGMLAAMPMFMAYQIRELGPGSQSKKAIDALVNLQKVTEAGAKPPGLIGKTIGKLSGLPMDSLSIDERKALIALTESEYVTRFTLPITVAAEKLINSLLGGLQKIKFVGPAILKLSSGIMKLLKGIKAGVTAPFKLLGKVVSMAAESISKGIAQSIAAGGRVAKAADIAAKLTGVFLKAALNVVGKVMSGIMNALNLTGWIVYWIAYGISYLYGLSEAIATLVPTAGGSMVALIAAATACGTTSMLIFDLLYLVIIMPIVLGLTMSDVLTKAFSKVADSNGCCPDGYAPLNQMIPEWCSMLFQMIPIFGDLLGMFDPYICFGTSGQGIAYRHTLTLPKYLNYSHLTTFFLCWPEYDCSTGSVPIHGKTITSSTMDWNNNSDGYYTNLDDIITSINNHDYNKYRHTTMNWHSGTQRDYSYEYLMIDYRQNDPSTPPPVDARFFYADFTEPSMLVQMAQFYYNYASKDLVHNIDGTVSVQYISKINYVAASSLYSCDVMCEMVTVTYDPLNGTKYSEVISYDHDRRFYFNVNATNSPLPYWENTSNTTWKTLDDAYDRAMYNLNDRLHVDQNSNVSAEILLTAYIQKNESYQRFSDAATNLISNYSSNYPTGTAIDSPLVLSNYFISQFYTIYQGATSNYLSLFSNAGLPQPTYSDTFDTAVGQPNTPQGSSNAATIVESYLSTVVGCSNNLWRQHLTDRPPTNSNYFNKQYTVVGCTKLDQTASSAFESDVTIGEYDTRYKVDFNVRPYLQLCKTTQMNMFKCMDPSNLEIIIYNYYVKNPNKRIRSIKSIKAKGQNCCEYIWDEDDINADGTITASHKDVNTQLWYQMDLSSCTFCLPTSNTLVGSGNNITSSSPYKMVVNPPTVSSDPNYTYATTSLSYKSGFYNKPNFDANNYLTGFTFMSNIDYVPRYYPYTYDVLPDLVRPKKPIRVVYPQYIQSNLGNISNNTCTNPNTIKQFLLDYNNNITNTNKILRVVRGYTSDSSKCDYEVDVMYSNNTVQRKTMTFNMQPEIKEGFQQNSNNAEVYLINTQVTLDQAQSVCDNFGGSLATLSQMSNFASGASWSTGGWVADNSNTYNLSNGTVNLVATTPTNSNAVNCFGVKPRAFMNSNKIAPYNARQYYFETPYTFQNVYNSNGGLNIQYNTAQLDAPYSNGIGFDKAYMDVYNTSIVPNIMYYNNSLINNYTNNIQDMFNQTSQMKVALNSQNRLKGRDSNSTVKCSDPEIMERIIEQYNIDNTPSGRYNQNQNTMLYIFKAGTADDGRSCRVMFDNQLNQYIDYYNSDRSTANFLSNDGRPAFINVQMVEDPVANNVFKPVPNQVYSSVPAADPYIASQPLLDYPYASLVRTIPTVDINNSTLYMQVMRDYQQLLGHQLLSIDTMVRISPTTVDYKVTQRLVARYTYKGVKYATVSTAPWKDGVIRATYNYPIYYASGTATNNFTYSSGNFKLHVYGTPLTGIVQMDNTTSFYSNYLSHAQNISGSSSNASPLITNLPAGTYTTLNLPLSISIPPANAP